ncbi:MAG: response regulator [Desulfobulbaceae bacterium]|nr:response regulator [Desulfobulbaceae bacterium]
MVHWGYIIGKNKTIKTKQTINPMPYQIAIVEDDQQLRANYAQALEREGYIIKSYSDRKEALEALSDNLPDMAILDVMLGEEMEGGFDLCRELRRLSPTIPIIFLTARNSDLDRVSGLRLGGWDYMTKDTTTLDFLPVRISALFRIVEALHNPGKVEKKLLHGPLEIDQNRKQATWKNIPISLTLTEYWILLALVRRPGDVKSYDQLMEAANVVVSNNAITSHIRRIREKFREADPEFNAIRSEYGMGYRWIVD